jgi:hypothetical protein
MNKLSVGKWENTVQYLAKEIYIYARFIENSANGSAKRLIQET